MTLRPDPMVPGGRHPISLSRLLTVASLAAALNLLGSLQLAAFALQCDPAKVVPSGQYSELVGRYASGHAAAAVASLGDWSENALRCNTEDLERAVSSVKRCSTCPVAMAFKVFPLRAAVMLHADRMTLDEFPPPIGEQPRKCGWSHHAQAIESLASILVLVDADAEGFLGPLYAAITRYAYWAHCHPQAAWWARAGLKRFPKNGDILLGLGVVLESNALHTVAPAPLPIGAPPRFARQHAAQTALIRSMWVETRDAFSGAVSADPSLHQARLRLGRVLWRLGDSERARECFEAVISASADPDLQYLAHLLLGRVIEDSAKLAEAESQYRSALALNPLSEPAAVAISHVRLLLGDAEGAREVLARSIQLRPQRKTLDPYINYEMSPADGARRLDELRRTVLP